MLNSQPTTWEVICKLEDYGGIISLKLMELYSWLIVPIKRGLRRVRQSWILCVSPPTEGEARGRYIDSLKGWSASIYLMSEQIRRSRRAGMRSSIRGNICEGKVTLADTRSEPGWLGPEVGSVWPERMDEGRERSRVQELGIMWWRSIIWPHPSSLTSHSPLPYP